jgi:DNA-binding transcriptional regulator YhcF (GntR family)
MPLSEPLPALMVHERKVRLAIQTLLTDPEYLPDGLYGELVAFRDMLDLLDLKNMHVKDGPSVSELLADILREQIQDGVLRKGMTLPAVNVAHAYAMTDNEVRRALDTLTKENLLAHSEYAEPLYVVVAKPGQARPRNTSEIAAAG